LLNPNSEFYNPLSFNAAGATFSVVDLLHPLVERDVLSEPQNKINPAEISSFLKKWTIKLGAVDVGFTLLQPHHLYSHIGRGKNYGKEVGLNHKYAIAFTVEMNHEALSYAPKGPIIMESAQQYLNAGTIALQVAQFIRNLGFDARAHIDANYRLICPVVAQDAGLGTIGRMGLLMTPKLGPRVRIGVVTTDLELEFIQKTIDSTTIQFCEICKKCTVNCPSGAISTASGNNDVGWQPWKINHEKCFTYWCKIGTDCGRCVSVCPYSHPNNFIHNLIRWGIKRNAANRWLALKLDDYFYGRKPPSNSL
jgi:reductive dehalogenase